MEVSGLLHDPAALLPGNKQVPIEYKVGSPQSWSEHFDKEKNLLPLPGFKPRFIQSVTYSLYHFDIQLTLKLHVDNIVERYNVLHRPSKQTVYIRM
jgi:hypothetical protein